MFESIVIGLSRLINLPFKERNLSTKYFAKNASIKDNIEEDKRCESNLLPTIDERY